MNTFIALFRGINVGGNNILPMKALAGLLTNNGCKHVKTYIQSGNVVFQTEENRTEELAEMISDAVDAAHGFRPKVLLLTAPELEVAIGNNPFPTDDGKALHFFFMDASPDVPDMKQLVDIQLPSESFELKGKVFYLYAPEGIGRSKLAAKAEKCLGVPTTARNWSTVGKLFQLSGESAGGTS